MSTRIRFGNVIFDLESGELWRGGFRRELPRQSARLLTLLVENKGMTVRREEIRKYLWPSDIHVQFDDGINHAVRKLRSALGDDARNPVFLKTVTGAGYILHDPPPDPGDVSSSRPPARSWSGLSPFVAAILIMVGTSLAMHRTEPLPSSMPVVAAPTVRPMTTLVGLEVDPACAPLGNRVAFAWDGPDREDWDIFVTEVGRSPSRVTSGPGCDHHAAWSPDEESIAYSRFYLDGSCEIRIASLTEGNDQLVGRCEGPVLFDMAWTRDNRSLIYPDRASEGVPLSLVSLDLDTHEKRAITHPEAGIVGDSELALSPDGAYMSFYRNRGGGHGSIWVARVDGSEPFRLMESAGRVTGLTWDSDSESVIVTTDRGGRSEMLRVPIESARPVQVLTTHSEFGSPCVLSDGVGVVAEQWSQETNIHMIDLQSPGDEAVPVVTSTGLDYDPAVSPDGNRVAFVSNRTGSPEIWVTDLRDGASLAVTSFDGMDVGMPEWSPDGQQLVFEGDSGAGPAVWVTGIDGGYSRQLTAGKGDHRRPTWSPDAEHVYYASNVTGLWQVHSVSTRNKRQRQLTTSGGDSARASRDGRLLFFTRSNTPGLWSMDLEAGEIEPVLVEIGGREDWTYAQAEHAIYFVLREDEVSLRMKRLDLESGSVRDVALIPARSYRSPLKMTPDRQHLLVARTDSIGIDLVVLEPSAPASHWTARASLVPGREGDSSSEKRLISARVDE